MPHNVTLEDVEALAYGGAILGGGGGGWPEMGLKTGGLALEIGKIELWGPDEADPEWRVITSAALGAPTERGNPRPMHYIRAAQLLREVGVEFHGVIAAENGGHNSFGGWLIAAALDKSVKTGVTEGSEVVAWGTLETTSNVIRAQARDMKALIAMARDPVTVSYTKEHGAPGALRMAMDLGYEFLASKDKGADAKVRAATEFLGGELICKGRVTEVAIEARGGFDVGFATVKQGDGEWELGYVNEYMTLEKDGVRLATFPDLVISFDGEGDPVTSAGLAKGQTVYVVNVPKEKILVGDGNRYSENYEVVEAALGRPMVKYLEGYLKG